MLLPHLNPADFKLCMCLSFLSFAEIIADATDNVIDIVIIKTTTVTIAAIPPAAYIIQSNHYQYNELETRYSQLSSPDNPLDVGTGSVTVDELMESMHPVLCILQAVKYIFYYSNRRLILKNIKVQKILECHINNIMQTHSQQLNFEGDCVLPPQLGSLLPPEMINCKVC